MDNVDYKDIDFGTSVITYYFPEGTSLPKKGEMIPTKKGNVLVVESSEKKGYIKVMVLEPISIKDRLEEFRV